MSNPSLVTPASRIILALQNDGNLLAFTANGLRQIVPVPITHLGQTFDLGVGIVVNKSGAQGSPT
jgi:hypothetical protein